MFLHSLGLDGGMWHEVRDCLPGSDIRTPTSLGHRGRAHEGAITLDRWTDDLTAFIDRECVGPVNLVGLSLGGIQAIHFAARHPGRVRALVVADSFAYLPDDVARARIDGMRDRVGELGMAGHARAYLDETLTAPVAPVRVDELARSIGGLDAEVYLDVVRACFTADVRADLADVASPTLVLIGERDEKTPMPAARAIADGIPGAQLRSIPGAGHLASIDNPRPFADALTAFLTDETVGSPARTETSAS
ncbi:Beta-ketoadipate enol-lactone hydrolase [Actinomycetales bacterium JB111]|nr:Beta-ketoadipate enol-lactone hydrolase [Actinomycetales bacterium JB111]